MTAEEKYYGYKLKTYCPYCLGSGFEPSSTVTTPKKICGTCDGRGVMWCTPITEKPKNDCA
jgi:DnaJ-class molecular chaperone